MTSITVIKEDNHIIAFTCNGHAGFNNNSQDIVCASISILVFNTLNSIEEFTNTECVLEMDENAGYIHCSFENELTADAELLLKAMILGLSQLQEEYGTKYIDVKIKEV